MQERHKVRQPLGCGPVVARPHREGRWWPNGERIHVIETHAHVPPHQRRSKGTVGVNHIQEHKRDRK